MSGAAARNKRWFLWLPLLLAGGWLALFGDKSPAGDAAASLPARRPAAPAIQPTAGAPVDRPKTSPLETPYAVVPRDRLFAIDATVSGEKPAARDLFSTRRWNPPPPPPPPEQPAPPPVAPPLPYAFLGKKLEGDTWEVFLSRAEQTFIARTGQILENDWRVDKIAPPTLALTYLPLGLPQTLSIGDPR
jgi:hypothetical protein